MARILVWLGGSVALLFLLARTGVLHAMVLLALAIVSLLWMLGGAALLARGMKPKRQEKGAK